jgi:DNA-binding NtrC family response regulator
MSPDDRKAETSIRVLVVDDETGFVDTLAKRLKLRDIETTKAYSGTESIRAMRGQSFDVCVLDLKMADMDGFETLKIMKKLDPEMPVIILSGHGSDEAVQEAMVLGAQTYLTKPCDLDALLERIREAADLNG